MAEATFKQRPEEGEGGTQGACSAKVEGATDMGGGVWGWSVVVTGAERSVAGVN
jgi:hypothetical protein